MAAVLAVTSPAIAAPRDPKKPPRGSVPIATVVTDPATCERMNVLEYRKKANRKGKLGAVLASQSTPTGIYDRECLNEKTRDAELIAASTILIESAKPLLSNPNSPPEAIYAQTTKLLAILEDASPAVREVVEKKMKENGLSMESVLRGQAAGIVDIYKNGADDKKLIAQREILSFEIRYGTEGKKIMNEQLAAVGVKGGIAEVRAKAGQAFLDDQVVCKTIDAEMVCGSIADMEALSKEAPAPEPVT